MKAHADPPLRLGQRSTHLDCKTTHMMYLQNASLNRQCDQWSTQSRLLSIYFLIRTYPGLMQCLQMHFCVWISRTFHRMQKIYTISREYFNHFSKISTSSEFSLCQPRPIKNSRPLAWWTPKHEEPYLQYSCYDHSTNYTTINWCLCLTGKTSLKIA